MMDIGSFVVVLVETVELVMFTVYLPLFDPGVHRGNNSP